MAQKRWARIRQLLEPILNKCNPELQFTSAFGDSSRENVGVVMQLDEQPLHLNFGWVDFIRLPDELLQEQVTAQLRQRLGRR